METVEKDSIIDFEKFFVKNESTMSPSSIFAAYKLKQKKNKKRKFDKFIQKAQIKVEYKKYWYKIAKEKIGTTENCRCYVVVW